MNSPARPRLLIVLICAILASLLGLNPGAAHADDDLADVKVTLTSITPEALSNSGDLTISGLLTNISDAELQRVEVRLWRDATPLFDLADLTRATTGGRPSGAVMESAQAIAQINAGGALAPGQAAEFSVQASLSPEATEQLWLSEPGAVYQVGVEVYGSPAIGGYQLLGRATSLLVYPDSEPIEVATLVVLAARPSLLPVPPEVDSTQPVFAGRALAAELGDRLDQLLSLAEHSGATTIIDPALYDEVRALAGPHLVRLPGGEQVAGSAADRDRATAWLTRLNRLAAGQQLLVGLFGSPDLAAAAATDHPEVLAAAASALAADHPLAGLPLVVVPADLAVDTATLDALAGLDPFLVLGANLGAGPPLQSHGDLSVLSVLDAPKGADVQARARLRATELLLANEGGVPIRVVADQHGAALVAAEPSWQRPTTLPELMARHPNPQPLQLASVPEPREPGELSTATDLTSELFATFGELTGQSDQAAAELARALATGWSTTFAGDQAAQVDWLQQAGAPAAALLAPDAVQLRITDWVTTSEQDNLLPVTVNNNTTYPVQVRVHFESENPLRISVDDSELFTVEPGESATVRVSPRTGGNGSTAITAQLVTASGRPVGAPVDFVITGTAAGRVAWLIILASGAVLLVATSLRVRQVRRENR